MIDENQFMETVLNSPDSVKQFLIEHGKDGKPVSPISFFREEDRDKFIQKEKTKTKSKR